MTGNSFNIKVIKKLISLVCITAGSALIIEHLYTYGGFDIELLLGHEVYGLLLIIAGILISLKWEQLPSFVKAIKEWNVWGILDEGRRQKYK